eukprot:8006723-Pyramimonas_sp.AAC.1
MDPTAQALASSPSLPSFSVNKANLLDPSPLWSETPEVDVDTVLEGAIQAVSNAATNAFGPAPKVLRQPWINTAGVGIATSLAYSV